MKKEQEYKIQVTSKPMTNAELIVAQEEYFRGLEKSLGREVAKKLFDAYIEGIEEAAKLSR